MIKVVKNSEQTKNVLNNVSKKLLKRESPLSKTDSLGTIQSTSKPHTDNITLYGQGTSVKYDNSKRTNVLIDWLQIWCIGELKATKKYEIKKLAYGSKTFLDIYIIKQYNKEIATLACNPRSALLNKNGALLKLKNNILYCSDYCELLNDLLFELGYVFKSVSRLDIAVDFNTFKNNLLPQNLIKKYMSCEYTKLGRNKFTLHGEQKKVMDFQTLRFGNNTSDVSIYLYNKTNELQQKTMKHYIIEQWEHFKLDTKKDVWRLEISIKGNSWKYADTGTGEIRPLEINDLKTLQFLEGTYFHWLNKHFDMRINEADKKRSRLKKVLLFTEIYKHEDFVMSFRTDESNRMDKIFIRMLEVYNCEIRQDKKLYSQELEFLTKDYAYKKGLLEFYYKKIKV